MYVVSWTGSNADTYLGNLRRYTSDVVRAWPAGTGAVPPVPFSACDAPVVIAFDVSVCQVFSIAVATTCSLWASLRLVRVSLLLTPSHLHVIYLYHHHVPSPSWPPCTPRTTCVPSCFLFLAPPTAVP